MLLQAPQQQKQQKPKRILTSVQKDEIRRIARENEIQASKLKAIRREPSAFQAVRAAPSGPRPQTAGPDDPTGAARAPGPGSRPQAGGGAPRKLRSASAPRQPTMRQRDEARQIAAENAVLQRKLRDQAKAHRESELVRTGKGLPVDGLELWAKRLSIYDDPNAHRRAASAAGSQAPAASAASATPATSAMGPVQPWLTTKTKVPKDVACVICSGCGRKSWYLADGPTMRPHPRIPGVFYCSATCAEVDATAQRSLNEYYEKGVFNPARSTNESWVVNQAMTLERKLLLRNARLATPLRADEIKERSAAARLRELAVERAIAEREKAADAPGYDGERPCMWGAEPPPPGKLRAPAATPHRIVDEEGEDEL